jgi:hypothetical protein
MRTANWTFKWRIISWEALSLGLQKWYFLPLIKADWETPTSGWNGNYDDTQKVILSIAWLTAYVEFTITPNSITS